MPRLKRETPRFSESAIAGALEQQERLGGPFLRALSEPLYESLQPNPMDIMGLGGPMPVGMMRSQIYKVIRDAYPELERSAIANVLRKFSMETLDPIKNVGVVPSKVAEEMAGFPVEGLRWSPEMSAPFVADVLKQAAKSGKPIREIPEMIPPYLGTFKGESSVYLNKKAIDPLKTIGHEILHEVRSQEKPRYPRFLEFKQNPEEAVAEAGGWLTKGKSRESTIALLLDRFELPEKAIYDAVNEAEFSLQRARSGVKPFHYETLPERTSIERHEEKLGGPRRKTTKRQE